MVKKIKKMIKRIGLRRTTVLVLLFAVLFFILLQRLFSLQIIHGQEYADNFNLSITRERTIKSTRGNIRDRNGQLLAYNQLSYSVTLEDNGTYDSTREQNLTLNYVAYELLKILQNNGESTDISFYIDIDDNGEYVFTASGFTLNRFKADVYGEAEIDALKDDQINATAQEMMDYMCGEDRFGLVNNENPYTSEELESHGLPESFTQEETLEITKIRYILSTNSFQKYIPVTIATNVSEETVAEVTERKDKLQGVDIAEDSIRVYDDAEYFANLIGYTGKASAEELEALKEERDDYSTDAIVGKSGVEQIMETQLQGQDGSEKVLVDRMGKILDIDEESKVDPVAGNDVYLSIDKDLQKAAYDILEQKIAGILVENIINAKTFEYVQGMNTADIKTPIYDVYYALIENSVLDINHFAEEDATALEQTVYNLFQQRQSSVFSEIEAELTSENPAAFADLSAEMQEYQEYIVNDFLTDETGILSQGAIDSSDSVYQAWQDHTISMKDFLTYAAGENWIDISRFSAEGEYLDSSEVYSALADYLTESLSDDEGFSKIIYKYMLQSDMISGTQLCLLLYDQGVLEADETTYNALASGSMRAYDFMINKISNLEITPAQLALDPCSGSVVITDVKTGETLACVTYPGYDNNRLANNMDSEYFNHLQEDLSNPFYNKATQETRAPGSTFKILTAVAGIEEGIVTNGYGVVCDGAFHFPNSSDYVLCNNGIGHGYMSVVNGIANSCNDFFGQVGYDLGIDSNGVFSDSLGMETLTKYAEMFRMNEKSGLEIDETAPQMASVDVVRSSIGQSDASYTTSQLARYVTTIASRGISYDLTLFDKVTDADGNVLEDYSPEVKGDLDVSDSTWSTVHEGMRGVASRNAVLSSLDVAVAGKTGTAQEDLSRPSHGLFIGFAPYEDPEIAMAVRITNGYSSGNAVSVANDIFSYVYNLADESDILSGTANTENLSNVRTD
ncbi:MAG TPA: peptidase [Candidatus Blautia merdipullorum]|nr:peptidase [Candidatus Blautia merdipullorum]